MEFKISFKVIVIYFKKILDVYNLIIYTIRDALDSHLFRHTTKWLIMNKSGFYLSIGMSGKRCRISVLKMKKRCYILTGVHLFFRAPYVNIKFK